MQVVGIVARVVERQTSQGHRELTVQLLDETAGVVHVKVYPENGLQLATGQKVSCSVRSVTAWAPANRPGVAYATLYASGEPAII